MCFRNVIVIRSDFLMFEESVPDDRKLNDVIPKTLSISHVCDTIYENVNFQ